MNRSTLMGSVGSIFKRCGTYPNLIPGFSFIVPELGVTAPMIALIKLVLPEPFGPTIVTISFDAISKLTSLSALKLPYFTKRFFTSISCIVDLLSTRAWTAQPTGFDHGVFDSEACVRCNFTDSKLLRQGFVFCYSIATSANHKSRKMLLSGMVTSNETIQVFYFMCKAVLNQKIEGPICDRPGFYSPICGVDPIFRMLR